MVEAVAIWSSTANLIGNAQLARTFQSAIFINAIIGYFRIALNLLTPCADKWAKQSLSHVFTSVAFKSGAFTMRSARSLPNSEMALAPAFVIILVLVSLFAVGGYWLMKPTVLKNPGIAAYQAPAAAKVLGTNSEARNSEAKLIAAEAAATAAADKENRKLGLAANSSVAPSASAATRSADGREGSATPRQTAARVQKRQDTPGQAPRVAQRESAPSLFGLWRLF